VPGWRPTSAAASAIARGCIQMDPKDRFQTASEVLEALERERQDPLSGRAQVTAATASARWWWEFHQAAVAIVYAVMVWPTWMGGPRIGGGGGEGGVVAGVGAGGVD